MDGHCILLSCTLQQKFPDGSADGGEPVRETHVLFCFVFFPGVYSMLKFILRIPCLAISLLFVTYSIFGWQWFARGQLWNDRWDIPYFLYIFWGLITLTTLFFTGVMTAPLAGVRFSMLRWFQSDLRSFLAAVSLSFLGVILVVNLHITTELFILLAALMLTRLELLERQYGEWGAFWLLTIVAFAGLLCGWGSHAAIATGGRVLSF